MYNNYNNEQMPNGAGGVAANNSMYSNDIRCANPNMHCEENSVPINCDQMFSVTSLRDLEVYSKGALIRLSDFAEGMPFVARIKRPSMLALSKSGKIPNSLLTSANALFEKGGKAADVDNPKMLEEMYDVMEIICRAALVEPTYDDIIKSGLTLTDEQMMEIFSYTQVGVKALESFRKEQKDNINSESGE